MEVSRKVNGGPAPRNASPSRNALGPCRSDIGLGPWRYTSRTWVSAGRLGEGCNSRQDPNRYSMYRTFTIGAQTRVRLHVESHGFPWLALRQGRSYSGPALYEGERYNDFRYWARIDERLPAGTYTLEVTARRAGAQSQFELWAGIPGAPPTEGECVKALAPGETDPGEWDADCAATERPGSHATYYTYTPGRSRYVTLTQISAHVADMLFVWEGDRVIAQKRFAGTYWPVDVYVRAGTTYTFESTTRNPGQTGQYLLALESYGAAKPTEVTPTHCRRVVNLTGPGRPDGWQFGNFMGDWLKWPCHSIERAGSYARYYTFTFTITDADIDSETGKKKVRLKTSSPHVSGTFLYLREGTNGSGSHLAVTEDDAWGMDVELEAGTYTIETTTKDPGREGGFVTTIEEVLPPFRPKDDCITGITVGLWGTYVTGEWDTGCQSGEHQGEYARWYTFTLAAAATVFIYLESDDVDPVLYLREGEREGERVVAGFAGRHIAANDDYRNEDAFIRANLGLGTYVIEATTNRYNDRRFEKGEFTLSYRKED